MFVPLVIRVVYGLMTPILSVLGAEPKSITVGPVKNAVPLVWSLQPSGLIL